MKRKLENTPINRWLYRFVCLSSHLCCVKSENNECFFDKTILGGTRTLEKTRGGYTVGSPIDCALYTERLNNVKNSSMIHYNNTINNTIIDQESNYHYEDNYNEQYQSDSVQIKEQLLKNNHVQGKAQNNRQRKVKNKVENKSNDASMSKNKQLNEIEIEEAGESIEGKINTNIEETIEGKLSHKKDDIVNRFNVKKSFDIRDIKDEKLHQTNEDLISDLKKYLEKEMNKEDENKLINQINDEIDSLGEIAQSIKDNNMTKYNEKFFSKNHEKSNENFQYSIFQKNRGNISLGHKLKEDLYRNEKQYDSHIQNIRLQKRERSKNQKNDIFLDVDFESGFIDVRGYKGDMFYWYFPADKTVKVNSETPTILWLTGGPGCSSEIAVLNENGPFWISKDADLALNKYSWNKLANVLYIDQPLGTGFSEPTDDSDLVHNETMVADDMWWFLHAFFQKHPEIVDKPFYVTGESYAGHYIPAVAHYVTFIKPLPGLNLQGIAIGNGWVNPKVQYPAYLEFARYNKLITEKEVLPAVEQLEKCLELIEKNLYIFASSVCGHYTNLLIKKKNPYDITLDCEVPPLCYDMSSSARFLNTPRVQEALGVKREWNDCSSEVYRLLLSDWIKSTGAYVEHLLDEGMRVLIYSGDRDFICNWMGGLAWTKELQWKHKQAYIEKEVEHWKPKVHGNKQNMSSSGDLKQMKNLTFLRIFNAGHMAPMDKPMETYSMIEEFLTNHEPVMEEL